jgi:hypothetical protein
VAAFRAISDGTFSALTAAAFAAANAAFFFTLGSLYTALRFDSA